MVSKTEKYNREIHLFYFQYILRSLIDYKEHEKAVQLRPKATETDSESIM
jgi:hypothetical protein